MPLATVFAPAIALANDGFPLIEFNTDYVTRAGAMLAAEPFFDTWRTTYGCNGEVRHGAILRQPDLARTYEAIAANGPTHLYGGALGRALVAHLAGLGGCLTESDLESVRPTWLEPLAVRFRDLLVHTLPPPCEGFQFLLTLRLLDSKPVRFAPSQSVDHLDFLWRSIRLAAGVRIAHNNPSPDHLLRAPERRGRRSPSRPDRRPDPDRRANGAMDRSGDTRTGACR